MTPQQQRAVTLERVRERREREDLYRARAILRGQREWCEARVSARAIEREPIVTIDCAEPKPQPRKWWEIWK